MMPKYGDIWRYNDSEYGYGEVFVIISDAKNEDEALVESFDCFCLNYGTTETIGFHPKHMNNWSRLA